MKELLKDIQRLASLDIDKYVRKATGWRVIRIWDDDINHDLPNVITMIENVLSEKPK